MKIRARNAALFLTLALLCLAAGSADAAQIKKIYRGFANFDTDDVIASVDIGGTVDRTKSIVLLTLTGQAEAPGSNTAARDQNYFYTVQFEDNSTISISRGGATCAGSVAWQVVEFNYGVVVQSGISSLTPTATTKTIDLNQAITTFNNNGTLTSTNTFPANAIPIVYGGAADTANTRTMYYHFIPTLVTNGTQIKFDRLGGASAFKTLSITWQVLEFTKDAAVQTGNTTIAQNATSATNDGLGGNSGALSPVLNNSGNNALLFFYLNPGTASAGADARIAVRGVITNTTTLTFNRAFQDNAANTKCDVRYYVVDFREDSATTNYLGAGQSTAIADGGGNSYHQIGISPGTTRNISSSTNASPIRVTTSAAHGYVTGQYVLVSGHTVNTNANGWWLITVQSATTFDLNGSTGNGVGGATGTTRAKLALTGATDATPILVTTTVPHYLITGGIVNISDVSTNVATNGNFFINAGVDCTTGTAGGGDCTTSEFELVGSSGSGAGAGSGSPAVVPFVDMTLAAGLSVDTTRTLVLHSASGGAATTSTLYDDLAFAGYLKSATVYSTARDNAATPGSTGTSVVASVGFNLIEFPVATVTAPNGGETWVIGASNYNTVTWKTADSASTHNWKLQYKIGAGSWTDMGSWCGAAGNAACSGTGNMATAGNGTLWRIPDPSTDAGSPPDFQSANVKVKIYDTTTDISDQRTRDASNADFKARGSLSNLAPGATAGVVWNVGQAGRTITWSHTGNLGAVRIRLDKNGNGVFTDPEDAILIDAADNVLGTANTVNWNNAWDSAAERTDLKLYIELISDPSGSGLVNATSANTFEIRPSITVTQPISAAQWAVGRTNRIEWTRNGTLGNVDMYISFNSGAQYYCINSDSSIAALPGTCAGGGVAGTYVGNNGYWDWNTPATATRSATCIIKVQKNGSSTIYDIGPNDPDVFSIISSLDMTAPLTSTTLRVNNATPISWSIGGGPVGSMDIYYTTNWSGCQSIGTQDAVGPPASCWAIVPGAAGVGSGASPFSWSVNDIIGTNVGLRMEEVANRANIYDKDGPYVVKGQIFNVSVVNSAGTVRVGATPLISWSKNGTISTVSIALSTNGGSSYAAPFATGVAGTSYGTWTPVAGEMSETCKIKVYLASDSDPTTGVAGETAPFKIRGDLTNGARDATDYNIGQVVKVSWTTTPSNWADSVKLYYSTDGGLNYVGYPGTPIVTPPATGDPACTPAPCYNWTLLSSYPVDSDYVVKVEHNSYTDTLTPTPTFEVHGTIGLTGEADAGGAGVIWKIGEVKSIGWTKTGTIGNIEIRYSKNNGADQYPYLIKTINADSFSSYSWCVGYGSVSGTPPDNCSNQTAGEDAHHPDLVIGANDRNSQIKIKLIATADDNTTDVTTNGFNIDKQYQSVSVPAPTLYVGDSNNVTWTTKGNLNASQTVKLRYSINSGVDGFPDTQPLNSGGAALTDVGAYSWTVPDAIGYNVIRVRVKSNQFPSDVYGDTGDFTIRGKIIVNQPTGASTLIVGNTYNIQYEKRGTLGNMKIRYNRAGCGTPIEITPGGGTTNATSFDWTVAASDGCSNNIIDSAGSKNSSFYFVGATHEGNTNLEASATSASFQVRGEIYKTAPTDFVPNGGEVWQYGGSPQFIKWKTRGDIGNVRIRLNKCADSDASCGGAGNNNYNIVLSGPGSTVKNIESSTNASPIVITSTAHGLTNGTSVTIAGHLVNTNANGTWTVASATANTFALSGSTGNGVGGATGTATVASPTHTSGESIPYNFIDDSCSGACSSGYTGAWEVTVPDQISSHCVIRVESTVTGNDATGGAMATYRVSEANFRIGGSVSVTSPDATLRKIGDQITVTWTPNGTIGNVDIDLCKDNDTAGPPYATCDRLTPGGGVSGVSWGPYAIPASAAVSSYAAVKVTSIIDSLATDYSDEFKIFVPVGAPANTNEWVVGTQYNVTWTAPTFDTPSFKIELSTDNGNSWPGTGDYLLASGAPSAGGSFSWTIPDTTNLMSNQAIIRVSKASDVNAKATSGGLFYIKGSISNVHVKTLVGDPPPGTPIDLPIGANKVVTWSYTGSLGTVNVQYATDADQGSPTWQALKDNVGTTLCQGVSVGSGGTGSCAWTNVPSPASSKVKVRVLSVPNGNWLQVSQASPNGATGAGTYNSIIGSIAVVDPDAVQRSMEVGGTYTIEWAPQGFAVNHPFKIEYWYSSSPGWVEITNPATGTPGTVSGSNLTWVWPTPLGSGIPNTISNTVKFRVSDFNDPNKVKDESNATNHIIKGTLSLVSPDTGPTWDLRDNNSITWNKKGSIGDIKIELSLLGDFSDAVTLVDNLNSGVDGNNSWTWSTGEVPPGSGTYKISETAKIRIGNTTSGTTPPAGTALTDTSASAFKIRPELVASSITSPALNEEWNVGLTNKVITWSASSATAGTLPQVNIQLDKDGNGVPESTIATVNCADGVNNYTWAAGVADERTSVAKIKISLVGLNDHNAGAGVIREDISSAFKIWPKITLDGSITASTRLIAFSNNPNLVKWSYTGTKMTTVNVRYDLGGANTFTGVIQDGAAVGAGAAGVTWNAATIDVNNAVKIRVYDPNFEGADPATASIKDTTPSFQFVGDFTVVSPSGSGTSWDAGATNKSVTWNFSGTMASASVYYDLNGGLGANGIDNAWNDAGWDDWTAIPPTNVKAQSGSSGTNISLAWNPLPTAVSNNAMIKITNGANANPDHSDNVSKTGLAFKIGGTFEFTAPENGAVVTVASTGVDKDITWTPLTGTGITNIRIEYTNNDSNPTPTWTEIDPAVVKANTGLYSGWVPPGTAADLNNDCRIRISQKSPDNSLAMNTGGGTAFRIKAKITVTEPVGDGSESWLVGTNQNIKFKKWGAIQSVDFYYSYDGTAPNYVKVNGAAVDVSALADNTVFTWSWPISTTSTLTAGQAGKVKVVVNTPSTQNTVEGIQTGTIQVKGSVTMRAPGGDLDLGNPTQIVMTANSATYPSTYAIRWSKVGNIANVKLDYSTADDAQNNGIFTNSIGTFPAGGDASCVSAPPCYNWPVVDAIGTNLRIRVMDAAAGNSNVWDQSDYKFRIRGKIRLDVPTNPGVVLKVGDAMTNYIKWTPFATFSNVEIHYSTDGTGNTDATFGTPVAIAPASIVANTAVGVQGSATWNIPTTFISGNVRIRVRDAASGNSDVYEISTNPFKVVGKIDVTGPDAGGIVWNFGDTNRQITWDATGPITNVKIQYKTSAGGSYTVLKANEGGFGSGSRSWTWNVWDSGAGIPDEKSETCYIQVLDANFASEMESDASTVSTTPFSIRPVGYFDAPAANARIVATSSNASLIRWHFANNADTVTSGKVSSVNVEYDLNGGAGWQPVGTNPYANSAGTTGVSWNSVPDVVNNNVSLRVVDAANSGVLTSRTVKIVYDLDLTTPPETPPNPKVQLKYNTATPYLIAWTKTGAATGKSVSLWLSKTGSGGPFNYQIKDSTGVASSPYSWNLSLDAANLINNISSNCVIRVADTVDSETKALSAPISIQSILDMTAPEPATDGALTLNVDSGSTYTVRWTTQGSTAFAKLQYSTDGGTNWVDLQSVDNPGASNIANNSGAAPVETTYLMKVTDAMRSENFKMRVGDAADLGNGSTDPGNWNASATSSRIRSKLDLLQPLGAVPASNQALLVGSTYKIRWSLQGTMSTVKLQYSYDGGAFADITTPVSATNIVAATGHANCTDTPPCFNWTVPDTISDDVKVRVVNEQALTPEQYSESPNFFHITGQLAFNPAVPGAGDTVWYVHRPGDVQQKTVTWVKTGTVSTVDLQYSTDGTNFSNIPGGTGITGLSDQFDVFDAIDPTVLVRAVNADATKPTIVALSSDIQVLGKLTITAPTTDEKLDVDSNYVITWATAGTIAGTVKLEYSTDNFTTPLAVTGPAGETSTALAPGAHNTTNNTFTWKVPNNINNTVKLRITANTANQANPFTTTDFKIRGAFKLLTPNGTNLTCTDAGVANQKECYQVDGAMGITWERHGSITNAKLQYSTDNFLGSDASNNFTTTGVNTWDIVTVPATDLSYSWTPVYDRISETVKVRIVDPAHNNTTVFTTADPSDSNLAIRGKIDTLTLNAAPIVTGTTVALIGSDVTVAWVKHGTMPSVKVQYRSDMPISASTSGAPIEITTGRNHDLTNGDSVTIAGHTVNTNANGTWTVTVTSATKFTLNSSSGNGVGGATGTVTGPYVQMLNSGGGNADSLAGTSFLWRVPDKKSVNGVTIKITNLSDPDDVTTASNAFTIRGGFGWTNPTTVGQVFKVNHAAIPTMAVTWSTFGTIPNIHLKYSTNNDSTYDPAESNWNPLLDGANNPATNIVNSGSFNWKVPDNISKDVYLVAVDPTDAEAKQVSVKVKIAGVLFGDEPDNDPTQERWGVTTTQTVRWTLAGTIGNVKIEYTKDGDTGDGTPTITWETPAIVDSRAASTLFYDWTNIPLTAVSSKAAIRISDVITDSGTDPVITPLFKIVGTFSVTTPAAASAVRTTGTTGSLVVPTQNIAWSTNGSIAQVDFFYSTTGGAPGDCNAGTWTPINTGGAVNNTSPYAWTVPSLFSNTVVVRIRDAADSLTCNDSGVFSVRGDIKLTAPNGGEIWKVGQNQNILWDVVGNQGSPNEVYIEFKKGAGGVWSTILDPITFLARHNNDGATTWNVPENEVHSQVYLRIYNTVADTDLRYKEVQSAASFKLVRRYQITSLHAGGDVHVAGTAVNVTWNKWGTVIGDPNGGYGNVLIDFAKNGTTYSSSISGGATANDGIFSWTPTADDVSTQNVAKIRIADTSDTLYESTETSSSGFTVRGVLTLDAIPATVKIGDVYDVRWQRISNVPNVILTYSKTGNFSTSNVNIEDQNGSTVAGGLVPNNDSACLNNPSYGCHKWKVPDLPAAERGTIKVRIQDPSDLYTAYDGTDPKQPQNVSNVFKVIPKFAVTFPNGNADPNLTDKLKVGQIYNVTWTSSSSAAAGYTPTVKVMFSTDGGANYFAADVIAGSTANGFPNGSVQWNYNGADNGGAGVHNRIGTQVRVRVEELGGDAAALDQSDNNCKIVSNLALNSPGNASGQVYTVGQTTTFDWSNIGGAAFVHLMYSTNGNDFTSPFYIPTNTSTPTDIANSSPYDYTWTIPDKIGYNVRVRVKSKTDDGDAVAGFNMRIKGKLEFVAGNGDVPTLNQKLNIGQPFTIDWTTTGTIPNVDILYARYGGTGPDGIPGNGDDDTFSVIADGIANTGNWQWPLVLDQPSDKAKFRVRDDRDTINSPGNDNSDVYGESPTFNIVGNFTITAPNGSEDWRVATSKEIKWRWGGTIPIVKLYYTKVSINQADPLATAITGNSATGWKEIDPAVTKDYSAGQPLADGLPASGAVNVLSSTNASPIQITTSANHGLATGNSVMIANHLVNTNANGTWTVTVVNATQFTLNGSTGNGVGGATGTANVERKYTWTVPNDISNNVTVMVQDAAVTSTVDVSNAVFFIRGSFTVTAPNGNADLNLTDRWVTSVFATGQGRTITWNTSGTVANVKLEYSDDDFAVPANTRTIAASTSNTGSYLWEIPDDVLKDGSGRYTGPRLVKVRVSDVNDSGVYDTSDFSFKIDYYQVTWEVRDLGTYALLPDCSVIETKSIDPNFIQWQESGIAIQQADSVSPPVVGYVRKEPTPAGAWTATWKKTGYGDLPQSLTLVKENSTLDPRFLLLMETTVIHITRSEARFTYDPVAKRLDVTAWRERDGALQSGILRAEVDIYDGSTLIGGGPLVLTALSGGLGLWTASINNSDQAPWSLAAGKTYNTVARTQNAAQQPNSVWTATPHTFEITTPSKLEETRSIVAANIDKPLSQLSSELQTTLNNQTTTITTKLDQQTALIQQELDTFEATIQSSIVALESAADLSLESAETLEATALKFSWKAIASPNPALASDTVKIQVQGPADLAPVLNIYNHKGKAVVTDIDMDEETDNPGNYKYEFKADTGRFEPGQAYTYVVTEETTGGLVAGSGMVESISLTSVAGLASAAPAAEKAAKQALEAIKELESTMAKGGDVRSALKSLQKSVNELPSEVAKVSGGDTKRIRATVNEISERLQKLAGSEGMDFSTMIGKAIDDSSTIQDIRGRSEAISQTMEVMGAVVEQRLGGVDEPVVATFFEA